MAKKKTTEKALNIDNILFNCRDYLRAARNSGSFFEKRDMMLTLVFLDVYKRQIPATPIFAFQTLFCETGNEATARYFSLPLSRCSIKAQVSVRNPG